MGKRRDAREQIEAKIVELGRRQLLDHGAAGLSLRAIARNLGMVSSAVYRYVSSRDELLTLLLVDAYSDLADTVDRARDDTVADSWSDDVIAIARAVRGWAVTNPARWALLYGSPVPGYHAPPDRTAGVATRVVGAFFDAIAAGIATGDIRLPMTLRRSRCHRTSKRSGRSSAFPATIVSSQSAFCSGRAWWARSAWRYSVSTGPTC